MQLPQDYYLNGKFLIKQYQEKPESFWLQNGRRRVFKLFHEMAQRVPAYKNFLKKNKINPHLIKKIDDIVHIPPIDKDSYLRKYPLPDLCWDGNLNGHAVISATSGSTGEPFYFPRSEDQDLQYAALAETYLLTNFQIDKKSTLYIIGFPMGVWIGGVFTYQALRYIKERGNYKLTIISPGIHKEEIIKAVKKLGKYYDQIIIGSYGPFLKDILDDGERHGINWTDYSMRFVFSAEGFTEEFRDYVLRKVGNPNPYVSTLNHYGTVDLGTMSYETPVSIYIRRKALEDKKLNNLLFGDHYELPTFTQYDPQLFYFEQNTKGRLMCSAYSGIPLVKYDLKDNGGIKTFSEVMNIGNECGFDLQKDILKAKLTYTLWKHPFVYVYERSDFSVSFHAFQIYPSTIRKALQKNEIENFVTGKFTMMVKFDKYQNQFFEVNVELKNGISTSFKLKKQIQKFIFNELIHDSSEYRETYRLKGNKILPKIVVWEYEDELYFKPGTKQKWVKK